MKLSQKAQRQVFELLATATAEYQESIGLRGLDQSNAQYQFIKKKFEEHFNQAAVKKQEEKDEWDIARNELAKGYNPEKLTNEQVGKGWRLLELDEPAGKRDEGQPNDAPPGWYHLFIFSGEQKRWQDRFTCVRRRI